MTLNPKPNSASGTIWKATKLAAMQSTGTNGDSGDDG